SPGVIAAGERRPLSFGLGDQLRAAMGADVVEGADHPVLAVGDQDRGLCEVQVTDDETARLRQLADMADVHPAALEDRLAFERAQSDELLALGTAPVPAGPYYR